MNKVEQNIADQIENVTKLARAWRETGKVFDDLLPALDDKIAQSWDGDLCLSLSGSRADLTRLWRILREHQWTCIGERPTDNSSYWSGFFDRPDIAYKPRIYLSFSSTVCRRVKIGTRTQEVDVYETTCGDGDPLNKESSDELI